MEGYNHKDIEKKWQDKWEADSLYNTPDKVDGKENFYTLVEFPYPSGNLHVGHWYAFAVPDIFARFKRMQGFNVMYPIGFDSFGLPAENAAIKRGLDPKEWTYSNIDYMSGQLRSMGNMFDWRRKVVTSDPEYYKWTQWLFIELFKKGLAYKKKGLVNWCPSCQTVLANEQVIDGACERCGTEVTKKDLEQWYFKITEYAEKLLSGLDDLKWPEPIKESQRNWIGKSEGAEFTFNLTSGNDVTVFTTRADTLFGVTYVVLAPEHPLVGDLLSKVENKNEIETYIKQAQAKTEIERTDAKREKTGVELKGIKAKHPATGEEVSVWVADYVLAQYGTGAVMAVPAHDERDFAFAQKYNLPVKHVVAVNYSYAGESKFQAREGIETIERRTVTVALENSKGEILVIFEPETITLIGGGIDGEETPEQAARREIKEETGYVNVELSPVLIDNFFALGYRYTKQKNVRSNDYLFTAKLIDETKVESEADTDRHNIKWVSKNEVVHTIPDFHHHNHIWRLTQHPVFTDEGMIVNSNNFNGLNSEKAKEKIAEKYGAKKTTYKLRDWLLSRQRYWGCPIPVVYDPEGQPQPVPEEHLPWLLPTDDIDLTPKGTSPLGSSKELLERTEKIFGKGWKPEVDTMDTFVDSSWYFLRYTDPHNEKKFSGKDMQKNWMPVKRYSGGAEHTTMHLLYSRFFHKALFDLGLTNQEEPFEMRMNRGLILGPDGQKMSKSKGNVIDPGEHVERVGSDTVKMYLAFIGPYNEVGQYPWDLGGIAGVRRFLEKVWSFYSREDGLMQVSPSVEKNQETKFHQMIKSVTEDIEKYKFNTAIAIMMKFVGTNGLLREDKEKQKEVRETFLKLLAPLAPHMTEELWEKMGHTTSIHLEIWPNYEVEKLLGDEVTYAIQINGKLRGELRVVRDTEGQEVVQKAQSTQGIKERIEGKKILKTVFVKERLVNFVIEI